MMELDEDDKRQRTWSKVVARPITQQRVSELSVDDTRRQEFSDFRRVINAYDTRRPNSQGRNDDGTR